MGDIIKAVGVVGLLLVAALLTAKVISICVTYLNRSKAKEHLSEYKIKKATVKKIIKNDSVKHIKFDALTDDGKVVGVDIEAEDFDSSEIYEGVEIYT